MRGQFIQRRIDIGFKRNGLAAAQALVSRNYDAGLAILDPARQCIGGKASEHHRMHSANARTGQHGNRRFGHHRQIKRYPVTLGNAVCLEGIGKFAYIVVQLAIGDLAAGIGRIIRLPDDGHIIAARRQMTVETICRNVELAAFKPANAKIVPVKGCIPDGIEILDPVDPLRFFAPEPVRIGNGPAIFRFIASAVDQRIGRPLGWNRKNRIAHCRLLNDQSEAL